MSTPPHARRLMTAEEYARLPDDGKRYELVRGALVEMSPPSRDHGAVAVRIALLLGRWNDAHRIGRLRVETGFVVAHGPDTVRGPDVSFVRYERDADIAGPWVDGGPDLAVEIRSPGCRPGEIGERVADYLRAGTPVVWIVDPAKRSIVVRTPSTPDRVLTSGDQVLDGGEVLPGFSVRLAEVFEDLDPGFASIESESS